MQMITLSTKFFDCLATRKSSHSNEENVLLFEHVVRLSIDVEYWYWHFSNVDLIAVHVDELFVRLNRNNVSVEAKATRS